mgnify:CR=1 FL=1|tara:strand:+ start:959 stop:1717 length:759 start_codon:yes stop_codon:yes gene_type:complete
MILIRPFIVFLSVLLFWHLVATGLGIPSFILPEPLSVIKIFFQRIDILLWHASVTLSEIVLGLIFGTFFGTLSALSMAYFRSARSWLLPILVVSQAIPVFALAPVLVLWFGYGIAPKVAMATLIIYFPVTAALYDGLRRTELAWVDLAVTMGASKFTILRKIRIPAALPAFASGIRIATAVAPIGAIVGEWVGASAGLGYYMLLMNGRVQIDAMFAALFTLAIIAVFIYFTIDALLRRWISWHTESDPTNFN